jgi:hypothetical protein
MGGFIGLVDSVLGGASPEAKQTAADLGAIGKTAAGAGQQNLNTAANWYDQIISGDPTKQAQAIAPEVNAAKTSAQQDLKTSAMQGNRSGGTNASNAMSWDNVHAYITDLLAKLTQGAASGLAGIGGGELSTGVGAAQAGGQLQLQNQKLADAVGLGPFYTGGS